jgi:hypothetical protein
LDFSCFLIGRHKSEDLRQCEQLDLIRKELIKGERSGFSDKTKSELLAEFKADLK